METREPICAYDMIITRCQAGSRQIHTRRGAGMLAVVWTACFRIRFPRARLCAYRAVASSRIWNGTKWRNAHDTAFGGQRADPGLDQQPAQRGFVPGIPGIRDVKPWFPAQFIMQCYISGCVVILDRAILLGIHSLAHLKTVPRFETAKGASHNTFEF